MMCFAWNPKTPCWNSGMTGGNGETANCPSSLWFWLAVAGAFLLGSGGKKSGGGSKS